MTVDNQAVPGQGQTTSWATAQTSVPLIVSGTEAKFALWQFYSQNVSGGNATLAGIQSAYDTYIQAFIDLCHANGVIPILMTHIPSGHFDPARGAQSGSDDLRKSLNDAVRAKAASDVLVFDADSLVTDGGSPALMLPQYRQADDTHQTALGVAVMGVGFDALMRNYYLTH